MWLPQARRPGSPRLGGGRLGRGFPTPHSHGGRGSSAPDRLPAGRPSADTLSPGSREPASPVWAHRASPCNRRSPVPSRVPLPVWLVCFCCVLHLARGRRGRFLFLKEIPTAVLWWQRYALLACAHSRKRFISSDVRISLIPRGVDLDGLPVVT